MNFDEVIQLQVLKLKAVSRGRHPFLEEVVEQSDSPLIRQMCAKISVGLHDRLDRVTGLLGMTKRQFVEAALVEAIYRAEEVIERSGALEQGEL